MSYKAKVAFENNDAIESVICKAFLHKEEMLQEIARDEYFDELVQTTIYRNRKVLQMIYDGDHIDFKRRKYEGSAT